MRKIGQMSGDDSQGITLMQYVRVYKLLLVYRSFCTPTRSLFQFAPDKCNNGPKFPVRFSVTQLLHLSTIMSIVGLIPLCDVT